MNKSDLIAKVAARANISLADSADVVEVIFDEISQALQRSVEARIAGFGTFSVRTRPAQLGRNPRTGEIISIGEMNQPKFKAGKKLKLAASLEGDGVVEY